MLWKIDFGRFTAFALCVVLALASLAGLFWSVCMMIPLIVFAGLSALGFMDVNQRSHSILRNYPVIGHMRFLFEGIRPEIRQYLIESDQDEEPFSRDARSLVYQRAKGMADKLPLEHVCASMMRATLGSPIPSCRSI
jgi:glutamate synthase domain-containing protein 2